MTYVPPTVAAIKTSTLERLDMLYSDYLDTATGGELEQLLMIGQRELQDLLLTHHHSALIPWVVEFSTVAGTATYAQPDLSADGHTADRILRVSFVDGDYDIPMQRTNLAHGVRRETSQQWSASNRPTYHHKRGPIATGTYHQITFYPTPSAVYTTRVTTLHEPLFTASPPSGYGEVETWGYDDYIILCACIRVYAKMNSDASQFIAEKEMLRQRIAREAGPVDLAAYDTVSDVRSNDSWDDGAAFWGSR